MNQHFAYVQEGRKLDDVAFKLDGAKILRTYKNVFSGFAADLSDRLVERVSISSLLLHDVLVIISFFF